MLIFQVEGKEREIKRLENESEKCAKCIQLLKNNEKKQEKLFKNAEKDALNYCDNRRVDVTKSTRELDALKKEYQKQEKEFLKSVDGQSYDDINRKKICKMEQIRSIEKSIIYQRGNLEQAMIMLEKRKAFFTLMRSMSMRGISRDFTNEMDLHNLEGVLTPEYKPHLLHVNVRPKQVPRKNGVKRQASLSDPEHKQSSLANLSGGERSKTLVCLINALWNISPPPLRCLDEWDVFLDAVARKQVESMLVSTALRSGYQYIFISPQGSLFSDMEQFEWTDPFEQYKDRLEVFTIKKQ